MENFKSSSRNFGLHVSYLVMCKGGIIVLFTLIFTKILKILLAGNFYQCYNRKTEIRTTKVCIRRVLKKFLQIELLHDIYSFTLYSRLTVFLLQI